MLSSYPHGRKTIPYSNTRNVVLARKTKHKEINFQQASLMSSGIYIYFSVVPPLSYFYFNSYEASSIVTSAKSSTEILNRRIYSSTTTANSSWQILGWPEQSPSPARRFPTRWSLFGIDHPMFSWEARSIHPPLICGVLAASSTRWCQEDLSFPARRSKMSSISSGRS